MSAHRVRQDVSLFFSFRGVSRPSFAQRKTARSCRLFFQQGRPRMIDVSFEPDMEEWGKNHGSFPTSLSFSLPFPLGPSDESLPSPSDSFVADSVFIPEDSVLICTSVLLKLHMVSLSCRRAIDFETKKMVSSRLVLIPPLPRRAWKGSLFSLLACFRTAPGSSDLALQQVEIGLDDRYA